MDALFWFAGGKLDAPSFELGSLVVGGFKGGSPEMEKEGTVGAKGKESSFLRVLVWAVSFRKQKETILVALVLHCCRLYMSSSPFAGEGGI